MNHTSIPHAEIIRAKLNRQLTYEENELFNKIFEANRENLAIGDCTEAVQVRQEFCQAVAFRLAGEVVAHDKIVGNEPSGELLNAGQWLLDKAKDGFTPEEANEFTGLLFQR